jgi:Flp pilus assembly protein TadG
MTTRSRPRRRGQSMVEMAIMLPVMLLLFLGIVESAVMFFAWVTVQNAARTGTRVAVTGQGMSDATRVAQVKAATQAMVNRLYNGNTATITVQSWANSTGAGTATNDDAGAPCFLVQVQVTYTYSPLMPFIKSLMPATIVLKGTDRKLNEPWSQCT